MPKCVFTITHTGGGRPLSQALEGRQFLGQSLQALWTLAQRDGKRAPPVQLPPTFCFYFSCLGLGPPPGWAHALQAALSGHWAVLASWAKTLHGWARVVAYFDALLLQS